MAKMEFSYADFGYKSQVLTTDEQTLPTPDKDNELGQFETGETPTGMKSIIPKSNIMFGVVGILVVLFIINHID